MIDPDASPDRPKREPPDPKGHKPRIPKSVREIGGSDAEKAGAQEQRVNIGNAGKREHNL
jgi:hypothetical protein